jgi:hypothetical protein
LRALANIKALFTNCLVPLGVNICLLIIFQANNLELGRFEDLFLAVSFGTNSYLLIVTFFMIFVSWKKGSPCWVKVAPMLYKISVRGSYVGFPILNTIALAPFFYSQIATGNYSVLLPWAVYFQVLQFTYIGTFVWTVYPIYVVDAKNYLALKANL